MIISYADRCQSIFIGFVPRINITW